MSYAQYGSIQATDYNSLVGGNPVTSSGKLNTVWATGGGTAGYGQTALANVSAGAAVVASDWANLVNKTANCGSHQGTSLTTVAAPVSGGAITYISAIPTNLTSIFTSKLNAALQGSTVANAVSTGTTWSDAATWTHTVTFSSGDAARYFFNAGGQIKITCSHPSGTGINLLLNNLASNVGTVTMSSPTSGTVTIAGTSYNGITRVGGGGNAPTISPNVGYFSLTSTNASVFTQTASTGPSGYLSTNINVKVKSNGTQGANGDAGSVITIYTIWDEIPNGLVVASGSTTTVTAQVPETTYLGNSWGSITVAGSVSAV